MKSTFKWLVDLLRSMFTGDDGAAPTCDCVHCESGDLDAVDELRKEGM